MQPKFLSLYGAVVLKRIFQLAVDRGQLDESPFRRVRPPRIGKKPVHVFSVSEC
jgi:hypothetical protein